MKLIVRKLWFRGDLEKTIDALFKIPQIKEKFNENHIYDGEMRPRRIKICSGYWPADPILDLLPDSKKDVYLVLTSLDLRGDYGRIDGKGYDKRAIMSNSSFFGGIDNDIFYENDKGFQSIMLHEIGHALGALHHDINPNDPCVMTSNQIPSPTWDSLQEIRLCDNCYRTLS